jgi:hypothetical protein
MMYRFGTLLTSAIKMPHDIFWHLCHMNVTSDLTPKAFGDDLKIKQVVMNPKQALTAKERPCLD